MPDYYRSPIGYTLNTRGEKAVDLAVTYSGGDRDRNFDVLVGGKVLVAERLTGAKPGRFFEKRYSIPADLLAAAPEGLVTVRFAAQSGLAGGVFDVRLLRPEAPGTAFQGK